MKWFTYRIDDFTYNKVKLLFDDNEINKDMYQVNINLENNGKGVIEIHFKSFLELEDK